MHKKSLLPSTWQVPDIFRERLGESPGRQRVMFMDGHLLVILHQPPGPEDEARRGRFFWRKPDGAWVTTTEGSGHSGLETHLDEFEEAVREAREVLDRETATQLVAEDTDVERLESILADVGIYGILDADDQGGWLTVTASETQRGAGGERFSLTNLRATLSTFGIDVTCFYRDGVFGIFAADVDAIR